MKTLISGRWYTIEKIWSKTTTSGKKVSMESTLQGYWFVHIGDKSYRCGSEIKARELYEKVN